jgi:hypothetical protein
MSNNYCMNDTKIRWRKSSFSGGGGNACVELGLEWRKSTYSGGDPNACVELRPEWRKSSFSGGGGNECVEVAHSLVAIRDSKNPSGPILRADLCSLLVAIKGGHTFE